MTPGGNRVKLESLEKINTPASEVLLNSRSLRDIAVPEGPS